ncbi:MAG: 4Fe-4S binding protein [Coriobacteriales bacterium]|jgi:anaerobic dimethyl sulfoxide reductase subunit B (iron-sulfur subunit)|nr:4Fe-4S binding protein [Coriobacteriales bacterium]
MSRYAFHFDGTRCTACKTCVFACKDKNDLGLGYAYRKVYEYGGGETIKDANGCFSTTAFTYNISLACNHCEDPVCVMVCPTGAMHRDQATDLVAVDSNVCIGCGYCVLSCPYNSPKVDRDKGHSVKCDGCTALVANGEKPVCVMACPARALDFGTPDEMQKKGKRANIAPLPSEGYTKPNLFIKASKDARPAGSDEGTVTNPLEVL